MCSCRWVGSITFKFIIFTYSRLTYILLFLKAQLTLSLSEIIVHIRDSFCCTLILQSVASFLPKNVICCCCCCTVLLILNMPFHCWLYDVVCWSLGTFTLSNLGMFGVDRFDAILPPGTVSVKFLMRHLYKYLYESWILTFFYILLQGAIMAVGASQPTVVGTKDGRIGMKNQMQVN